MFSIHSTSSDREIRFANRRGDRFHVELRGNSSIINIEASAYTDGLGLQSFFEKLASHERPWAGEEEWSSLEEEFRIRASCSVSGHVRFVTLLRGMLGAPEEWCAECGITSELGLLPTIAAAARRFFSDEKV